MHTHHSRWMQSDQAPSTITPTLSARQTLPSVHTIHHHHASPFSYDFCALFRGFCCFPPLTAAGSVSSWRILNSHKRRGHRGLVCVRRWWRAHTRDVCSYTGCPRKPDPGPSSITFGRVSYARSRQLFNHFFPISHPENFCRERDDGVTFSFFASGKDKTLRNLLWGLVFAPRLIPFPNGCLVARSFGCPLVSALETRIFWFLCCS